MNPSIGAITVNGNIYGNKMDGIFEYIKVYKGYDGDDFFYLSFECLQAFSNSKFTINPREAFYRQLLLVSMFMCIHAVKIKNID